MANYLNRWNGNINCFIPEAQKQANNYVWFFPISLYPYNVNWLIHSSNLSNSPFWIRSSHFQLKVSLFSSLLLLLLTLLLLTLLPLPSSQRQQNFNSFWFVAPLFTRITSKDWLTDWLTLQTFIHATTPSVSFALFFFLLPRKKPPALKSQVIPCRWTRLENLVHGSGQVLGILPSRPLPQSQWSEFESHGLFDEKDKNKKRLEIAHHQIIEPTISWSG